MEFSIPLPAYPGRAGNSLPSSLDYSSKVWGAGSPGRHTTQLGSRTFLTPTFAERSTAGWSASLGVPQIDDSIEIYKEDGQAWVYDAEEENANVNYDLFYIKRFRVIMPDGSTHEMRADDAPHSYGSNLNPGVSDTNKYGGTFLSTDGSRMRLEFNYTNSAWHNALYLPDGSRFLDLPLWTTANPTGTVTYIDRSGNKMTYNCGNKQWTDTLGRTLDNPIWKNQQSAGVTAGTQTFNYPGLDGSSTPQAIQLVWAQLSSQQSSLSYTANAYCSGGYTYSIPSGGTNLFSGGYNSQIHLCGSSTTFNPVVLTTVILPNGAKYKFSYNVYGEIERIDYPTGGYERFVYDYLPPVASNGKMSYDQFNRGVVDRYLSADGTSQSEVHWEYDVQRETISTTQGPYHVKTFNPDGSWSEQLLTDQYSQLAAPFGFGNPAVGRAYETRVYNNTTSNTLLRRTITSWTQTGPLTINSLSGHSSATRDLRPEKEISVIFETGASSALAAMSETVYDTTGNSDPAYFSSLNAKQGKKYNFKVLTSLTTARTGSFATIAANFGSGDVASVTEADFLYDSNYKTRNIVGLVTENRVKDGAGSIKAKTQVSYDESGYDLSSSGTMPTVAANSWIDLTGTSQLGTTLGSKHGLPTSVKSYYDITNGYYIETRAFYDQFGNARKARDGRGSDTETLYDDDYAFAYPTSVTTAAPDSNGTFGSSTGFITSTTYDYNTGLPLAITTPNGAVTKMEYNDVLLRLTSVKPTVNNVAVGAETVTEYGVPNSTTGQFPDNQRFVKVKTQIDGTNWKEGYTWGDGLGRTIKTQSVDSVSGDVFALTCYDLMGRVQKVTNPFRNVSNHTCSTTTGLEWTQTTYDAAGRVWKVTTADGAEVETTYDLATSGNQIGTVVTVKDQTGKLRRSITNALGQLKRVDEPNDSNQLGAIDSPNQYTSYSYDPLNNLLAVSQGAQTRSFAYDSLSRLKEATNPESATISYTYDENGNLKTKRNARDIKTVYDYDALNRVIKRCYRVLSSNSLGMMTCTNNTEMPEPNTLDVTYFYDDTNISNSKGNLTKVVTGNTSSPFSKTEYTEFDIMGRVEKSKQTTDGTAYNEMEYVYNLSGALIEEKYPSGRVVKNVLDDNGDLSIVQSKKNQNAGFWNYAQHFTYAATGAVSSIQLGNGSWESTQFNNRLQPIQIALGSTQNATDKLKLEFGYNTSGNADNNGNILSQTITVPSEVRNSTTYSGFTATQTYTYDSLNRIKDAKEMIGSTQQWKQTFSYDRYGNRSFDEGSSGSNYLTTTLARGCSTSTYNPNGICDKKKVNPTFVAGNNRITQDQDGDSQNDYLFDSSGNTTKDASSNTFVYDGENKQVEVKTSSNQTVGQYWYDGDGKRVKKYVPSTGETTVFVYDASGKMVAEYSTVVAQQSGAKVSYLTSDHLGSPRVNTDANGNVTARHDYQPFGEEVQRASYGNDAVRKQFTSYERDNETELDFAQARYYNKTLGRFNSPDEPFADQWEEVPQSWNTYSYVRNNPLNLTDPLGMSAGCPDGAPDGCYERDGKYYIKIDGEEREYDPTVSEDPTVTTVDSSAPTCSKKPCIFELPDSYNDWIPAYGSFRRMVWNMRCREYGGCNVGKALFYFGATALELTPLGTVTRSVQGARAAPSILRSMCFVEGTLVLTEDGLKPIEEIKAGDKVLSYNEKTKQTEYKTVVWTMAREAEAGRILSVKVEGEAEALGVTGEHPFYVRIHRARDNAASENDEGEWRQAKDLRIGDEIRKADGTWAEVESVIRRNEGAKVYNFEVADNHNYFVGQTSLLAHNTCFPDAKQLMKILNTNRDKFHIIKKKLLKGVKESAEKIGSTNPDIGFSDAGTVVLRHPVTRATIDTLKTIEELLP